MLECVETQIILRFDATTYSTFRRFFGLSAQNLPPISRKDAGSLRVYEILGLLSLAGGNAATYNKIKIRLYFMIF